MANNTINSDRTMQILDNLQANLLNNNSSSNVGGVSAGQSNNGIDAILNNLAKQINASDNTTSQPQVQPKPKKKKKRGFFKKIGGFFKKVGNVLKKALPIISTIAMFVPGIGTAIGGALKIASAAMGAIDAIKNKNPLGILSSVAGAFTGGAGNLLGKLGSVGGYIQKGIDMFKNSGIGSLVSKGIDLFGKGKEWLSNFTSGIGGKVTDWLTNKGPEFLRNYAGNIGSSVTNWLNRKTSDLFSRVTNNPTIQKITDFMNSGFGKSILDIFTNRNA